MKATIKLLLGIMFSLSIVFAAADDLAAEIVRGEVKYPAVEAQLFTMRANDGRLLLISWDKKTAVRNIKTPAAIKPGDYLIVDCALQGEQTHATIIAAPEMLLPPGIAAATFEQIDRFVDSSVAGPVTSLIDTRPPGKYDAGHIPGARSIPLERISKRTAGLLPAEKNAVIVFYDDGAEPDAAVKAAELTIKSGYTSVLVFKEGVRGWVKTGRLLASSPNFIRKNKPVLIDLRTADKVHQGHIEGAVNYPLAELAKMYGNFPRSRQLPVVVYGESDKEALAGAAIIRQWGYKNVTFFRGGTTEWLHRAEALESGPAAEQISSAAAGHSGGLDPEDFKMALISPQTVEIVDVRSDADYRKGHLQQGMHIPLQSINVRHKELSREKIQVVFAADADRAEMVYDFLTVKGYRVNFLDGAVEFDKNGKYTVK